MFDDLYRQERSASLSQMVQRPAEAPEEAGFWEGLPRAAGLGIMHGGARAAQGVGLAGAVIPMAIDAIAGKDNFGDKSLTEQYFDAYTSTVEPALNYWNLPADGIGKAGEIVHGLAGIALPLMAAGGNPELLMLTQGMGTAADLSKKGVDGQTAASAAMISAFTTGIGMKLPMAGKTLAESLALGVGGNVGVGVLDRASMKAILEHQDYDAVAAQYKPLDTTQMALDAFIGAAFGTLAHVTKAPEAAKGDVPPRKLTPDEQAAALAMNEVRTRDGDTLTRPGDIAAAGVAHDAQNLARMQMDAGQPVSVAHQIEIERSQLDAAYQRVLDSPAGDAFDPPLSKRKTDWVPESSGKWSDTHTGDTADGLLRRQGQDQSVTPNIAQRGAEAMPEIAAASERLATNPDMVVRLDDGIEVRADDAMRAADAEIAKATTEAKGFQEAIACALRFGE